MSQSTHLRRSPRKSVTSMSPTKIFFREKSQKKQSSMHKSTSQIEIKASTLNQRTFSEQTSSGSSLFKEERCQPLSSNPSARNRKFVSSHPDSSNSSLTPESSARSSPTVLDINDSVDLLHLSNLIRDNENPTSNDPIICPSNSNFNASDFNGQQTTLSRVGCCDTIINEGNRPTLYASLSGVDPRSTCQGTTSGSTPTTFDTFSASNTGNESHRETSFIPQGSVVEDIFNSYCCSCDHRYQHPGCQYHRDEPLRNFHSTNSTRSNSASATGSGSSSAAPPSFNCERSSSPSIQLQQE